MLTRELCPSILYGTAENRPATKTPLLGTTDTLMVHRHNYGRLLLQLFSFLHFICFQSNNLSQIFDETKILKWFTYILNILTLDLYDDCWISSTIEAKLTTCLLYFSDICQIILLLYNYSKSDQVKFTDKV